MKPIAIFLSIALALGAGACSSSNDSSMADEERKIRHVRNSAFTGEHLRVFLTLEDGTDLSVNSADDAIQTRPAVTPIPGHRANDWTFVKETGDGTSVAYALVSWDGDDPADYLMAGWWAQFHGQRYPDLSLEDSTQYAIVDGPEIDTSAPPELPPAGQATYAGPAGGLYTYIPGNDPDAQVVDEYEGTITIEADFASATLRGCIGCVGDLVTRHAHFGVFLGDEVRDAQALAAGYELHLGETPLNPNGTFENADVTVRHPERTVTHSEGFWGGAVSNIADRDGNPRLVTGFSSAGFDEADGSSGTFLGTFVGPSEEFQASGRR